jgi:hypothetical protein
MTGTAVDTLTAGQALTALFAAESLMFASLGIAIALSSNTAVPRRLFGVARRLATASAMTLSVLATAAIFAWWDLFLSHGSTDVVTVATAIGIATGIVAQPIFAWVIATSLRTP